MGLPTVKIDSSDFVEEFNQLNDAIKQASLERDESVAHCEVLNSALIQALAFMARETCDIEDEQQQKRIQDAVHNYKKALEQTPKQSLLLYDANVIASHNERMVECFKFTASFGGLDCTVVHAEDILENANQLRSRAKEGVE